MKSTILYIVAFLFCALTAQAQDKQLTILHTNDTHSTIYPLSANLNDTLKAGRGGFLRRINLIQQERAKDPDLLLFDSGDFSQGSPYYTLFKGDVEVGLMNQMGYDAGTIGNHEFDFGLDNMVRIFRQLHFPIVCSNYDFTGTELADIVKPYVILQRKGLKIGVFALCVQPKDLVDSKNYGTIEYLDPVKTANEMVSLLKAKKCDMIVCLSHLGWNIGGEDDAYVIERTSGIDLVLGGHSHSYMRQLCYVKNKDGQPVPVDQNGKHAILIGKIKVNLKKK